MFLLVLVAFGYKWKEITWELTFSKINEYWGHQFITTSYSISISLICSYISSTNGDVEWLVSSPDHGTLSALQRSSKLSCVSGIQTSMNGTNFSSPHRHALGWHSTIEDYFGTHHLYQKFNTGDCRKFLNIDSASWASISWRRVNTCMASATTSYVEPNISAKTIGDFSSNDL